MPIPNKYTDEQIDFLKINAQRMSRKELTECFNSVFHCSKSELAIKLWCNKRGLYSPNGVKFKIGSTSRQKELHENERRKRYIEESFETMAKVCNKADETKRRGVWEEVNGEVPKCCCIINLDGNTRNCDIDNLYCMPIKYRPLIEKNGWWFEDRKLTLLALKWCELFYTIKENAQGGEEVVKVDRFAEARERKRYCNDCRYFGVYGEGGCDYCIVTKKMRGCEPGFGCVKREVITKEEKAAFVKECNSQNRPTSV